MNKTCEKCIHHDVCRYPLEYRAFPDTCWKYEEERPHGEWIDLSDGWQEGTYECSNCKTEFVLTEGTPKDNEYNFCPNCGASMSANDRQVTGKLDDNTTLLYSMTNGDNFIGKEGEAE